MTDSKQPLVIFGNGGLAAVLAHYCRTLAIPVAAFCVDAAYRTVDQFDGLPNVDFEHVEKRFPPADHRIFIAIGASDLLGDARRKKMEQAQRKGYMFFSYCPGEKDRQKTIILGKNTFIMPHCTIDPFTHFGDGIIAWNGAVIAHHTVIGDYSFIAPGAVICGQVQIGEHCFIGANATIRDNLNIGPRTLVGAGAVITHDTEPGGVYLPARTVKIDKPSAEMRF